jgi:hypothetical protein
MRSSNRTFLHVSGALLVVSGLGLALACGGGSSSKSTQSITGSGQNVATLAVNSGATGNYANGVFTTVTVCVPGTSTCQTIGNILVDTGSIGLRLLSATKGGAFNLTLPSETDTSNNPFAECTQFLDGSFLWGPVRAADIKIAGESASSVPINVFGDTTFTAVPASCSNGGMDDDSLAAFGANGVLGVNVFAQDCGPACTPGGGIPNGDPYYVCPNTGCLLGLAPLAQQVSNPVSLFATDNNGVVVELPSVSSSGQTSATGSLVFGIGTQSNNALSGVTVIPLNASGLFTTTYKGTPYQFSFVDTGSNGYFFLDSTTTGLPNCTIATGFYCPTSTQNFSATIASTGVSLSVANAETLFNNPNNFVFSNLAGPNPQSFDWGLPFYFGHNVYEAIQGKSTSGGTGPFVAF